MNPTLDQLQKRWFAADAAWQAELERVYGARAGDARYTAEGRATPELGRLYTELREAQAAYDKANGLPF